MANKEIIFSIEIEGNDKVLKNLTQAKQAVKDINKELKDTKDEDAYKVLEQELIKAKAAVKEFNKEQRNQVREFQAVKAGVGSYEDLNAQLVRARQEFKKLSREERESPIGEKLTKDIQGLDKELKGLDKTIGQNFREVGNYEDAITAAFGNLGSQFTELKKGFKSLGKSATNTGALISKAFIAFQAIQLIVEGIGYIEDFVEATIEAERQIEVTFGTVGKETDLVNQKLKGLADTIGTDLDPVLQATNSIVSEFGGSATQAADLLAKGLKGVSDQGKLLSGVETNLQKISAAGIEASDGVALLADVTNKGLNLDVISKGVANLRTQTTAVSDALENAFGQERADQIFKTFQEKPLEGVKLVSQELQTLNQNSKEAGDVLNAVFGRAGKEDLTTVRNIATLNTNLDELAEKSGIAGERFDELQQANESLAAAQIEVSNSLKGVIGNSEAFTTNVKSGLLQILSEVLKSLSPLVDAFKNLFAQFKTGGDSAGVLNKVVKFLSVNLKIAANVLAILINGIASFLQGIRDLAKEIPFLDKALNFVKQTFNDVINVVDNLQSVFAGAQTAAKQFAKNVSNSFKGILIDLKIFGKQAEQLVKFGEADREVQKQIDALRKERQKLNNENISVLEAFNKGFEDAQKARLKKQAELEAAERAQAIKAEREKNKSVADEKAKGDAKLRRQEEKEAKKRLEALKKEQEKFLQEQQKIALTRAALINELSKKIRDQEVKNLGDTLDARLQTRENKFKDEIAAIEQNLLSIEQLQNDAEQEAIRLFGENSQQVIELRQRQAKELERIQAESETLQLAKQQEFEADKLKIIEDNEKKEQQLRQTNLNNTIADINFNTQVELTALKNKFAQGLIDQQEYNKQVKQLQLDNVQSQIDANSQELQALQQLRASGTAINEQYFKDLELKTQQLQVQQIELTNSIEQNNFIISESIANVINLALENTQKGIDFLDQIYASAAEKEQQRVDQQIQDNEKQVTDLEARLQQSAGLERQFLQQQIDNEIKEGQRLEKEKAKLEKEEAKRQKRFAIGQAIINGALAVTKVLATTPFPLSIAESIRIAATTAAEIAVISAQQFASGGKVGASNIKQLSNGDNVLATVKTGEVVLNKRQQKALGGDRTFASIGVPGFASGGLVGSVLSPPISAPISTLDEQIQFLSTLQSNTESVNNRIDNIQVSLNTDEEQREQEDIQENRLFATLTTDQNV